ncbi:ICOS ligand-like [Erpetoichthys calabaricus]|uniref:ICOS ligand-like n=1 Tax=Erpetoichthys calabaricus TaxID=27687 RepID=UPI002234CDAE|nr:ICOS ligand-like [Erpetoichthys calabaricus]
MTEVSADDCLTAITGETVKIPYSVKTKESLNTQDILIQWRTYEGLIVHTFVQGEDNLINQDKQFKGRTHLITSELSRGDFSLSLSDVSITDEGEYVCKYYGKSDGKTGSHMSHHCLQVAGHYSVPVVNPPTEWLKDKEVKFTCKSTGGFPKPKVYWLVNKKPLEDSSQVDTIVSTDCRAWYSVTSVLNVVVREDMSVTCTVENEKLGEKRTSPEIQCRVNHKCLLIEEKETSNEVTQLKIVVVVLVLVLVLGLVVFGVIYWIRRTCSRECTASRRRSSVEY